MCSTVCVQVMSLTNLPWTCKPVYGFISDAFPIMGYRRRPYIFLAGLVGSAAWFFMSTWVEGNTFRKFSTVSSILASHAKYMRALTFENL